MGKIIPQRISKPTDFLDKIKRKPKLLAPAGNWECARAAVENGADAIYFGLPQFNARIRADNFTLESLPELMRFLHSRGVEGYVTLNTLIFTHELEKAADFLKAIIAANVDAAIVQDVGLCRLIRKLSPDFPIHASTQMTVTSEAGIHFAQELGCELVVLARECTLPEVAAIKQKQTEQGIEMPLEIFVHGALCVAYSGQCLTSESLGGRSANRGECAQACRLPYELISDGKKVDLQGRQYLLSPQDLSGVNNLDEAIQAGVNCFKIEGRLKTPEYVAAVSQVYRQAIDRAWDAFLETTLSADTPEEDIYKLEMVFSRGLSTGWLEGIDNQKLVHARFGKKRGVDAGEIVFIDKSLIWIKARCSLKAGDGVVFAGNYSNSKEEGGRIYSVQESKGLVGLGFGSDAIAFKKLKPGQKLFKTSDPALDKSLRQSFEVEQPNYRRPISVTVTGAVGQPLQIILTDGQGNTVTVSSQEALEHTDKKPITEALLKKQLGRLGSTPFYLDSLFCECADNCFIPMSALNQMRRDAVEQLTELLISAAQWTLTHEPLDKDWPNSSHPKKTERTHSAYLIPYLRSQEQLETVLSLPYAELYLELEDPRGYEQAVNTVREYEQKIGDKRTLWIAPPRIFKTGEDWIMRLIEKIQADGLLARNHEHLKAWEGRNVRGDFSLNVTNPLSAHWYRERWKLERLTASYDLNKEQLTDLLTTCPPEWFEITLHQHMPMFHMEHCVFCAFLSQGKDYKDCGRPCEKHTVSLRDRTGRAHPLKADAGCRNTVFNARAQTGAEFAQDFSQAGAAAFRIEFLRETPEEVRTTLNQYENLLQKKISGTHLWKELKLINQLGVTRGTLRKSESPTSI